MKRLAITLSALILVTATAWTAIHRSRMKHPFSGEEITIPGRDGDGILLSDGAQSDLMSKNTANSYGAAIAAKMDFSDYDRADEQQLNQILWHSIKGANVPMPAPVRRAFFSAGGKTAVIAVDDDDDDRR